MEIKKVAVIGGGLMGRQIALNAAVYGYEAAVYDMKEAVCDNIVAWEADYLAGRVKKGRMTQEQIESIHARFHVERELEKAVKDADCVIEAIVEIQSAKYDLFQKLDTLVGEDVILATNSSYMVSSTFAGAVKNPARLANLHYYNPALVMKLVEIVQGPHTAQETVDALVEFCNKTGKKPVVMKKELEGFAGSRISRVVADEARWMVENGYLTPQEVDTVCENGLNYPMGPFRLNDFTGVDLTFNRMVADYEKTGKKPDMYDVYEQMVKEGRCGKKTGRGFYDYE